MADTQYNLSSSDLDNTLSSQFTPEVAAQILAALGSTSGSTAVQTATGSTTIGSGTDLAVIAPSNGSQVEAAQPTSSGTYTLPYDQATFVTASGGSTPVVVAGNSGFYELNGPMTIDGGNAATFVADSSHSSSPLTIIASTGNSYVIGGNGDTISGSTSSDGQAVVTQASGQDPTLTPITYMTGGLGADSLYGGGHSSITGGTGDNQQLAGGFAANASDTLVAGGGAHQVLAVGQGKNLLDDTNGSGSDTLFGGSGNDTLIGGANGATFALGTGASTVQGGSGQDNIYVSHGAYSDSIDGGSGNDFVTFNGYNVASMDTVQGGGTQYNFQDGTSATANTANGVTDIHFSSATAGASDTFIKDVAVIRFGDGTEIKH